MEKYSVYVPRLLKKKEAFAPGHRACIGCGEALAVRLACKALGENTVIVNATGCMEIVASQLPYSSWRLPWIHTLFENTAAVASGIEAGYKAMRRKGRGPRRDVKVVGIAGDGGTSDIGIQALSGAMERGHDFLYICFDNEAYMNTGIQRSSATPFGASTTTSPAGKVSIGQFTWKKDMPAIAAAHKIPYVATACCPTGWRCAADLAVKLGRLAVETGVFPLYEVENGRYKMNLEVPELRPVKDYLKLQGRFRHLSDDNISVIQERVRKEYFELIEKAKDGQDG